MSLTIKGKLLCQETDNLGYTTYVFKLLDPDDRYNLRCNYIMVTKWPNWNSRELLNGEIGYVSVTEIISGETTWFDGEKFIPYKYNNIQFNKFVSEQSDQSKEFKL